MRRWPLRARCSSWCWPRRETAGRPLDRPRRDRPRRATAPARGASADAAARPPRSAPPWRGPKAQVRRRPRPQRAPLTARLALRARAGRGADPGRARVRDPPRAGILFDVGTGEILWERHPDRELPIASLTKMMTARMIATEHRPGEKVLISKAATRTGGSMVGVLPAGKKVPLGALLKGLLLVSGNDAATALAEHDAGLGDRFVRRMNDEAERLGLDCTRFTSPHGLEDKGNHSCPRDLAELARADLAERANRRDRAHRQREPALPDRGRRARALQQQPLHPRGRSDDHRGEDRLHRRRRTLLRDHRRARRPRARRRPARLARPAEPGPEAARARGGSA